MGTDSPGPMYNTRLSVQGPGAAFSPRGVGKYPREEAIKAKAKKGTLPAVYSAGGPKVLAGMRTRATKTGVSKCHPAADTIFPARHPDPAKQPPGFLIGHTSTFGKVSDAGPGGHAGVQSNFAIGPAVRFAPPFEAVNERPMPKTARLPHQSPRLRKVEEVAGFLADKPPKLPPGPRGNRKGEPVWRTNKLFPYTNASVAAS